MNVVLRIGLALSTLAGCGPAQRPARSEPVAVVATPTQTPVSSAPVSTVAASEVAAAPDATAPLPSAIPLTPYKNAIENYSSPIQQDNQAPLKGKHEAFAEYIVAIHNRVHPVFSDQFLASLDSLPSTHPLNTPTLWMILEVVLSGDTGQVARLGVVRTSGITAFDLAALDSVMRGAPYGMAPEAIRSADGKVYLRWEFHREPTRACSTLNSRPYILK